MLHVICLSKIQKSWYVERGTNELDAEHAQ